MIYLLCSVFFVTSLLNAFLFGGQVFWSIVAAALSAAVMAVRYLLAAKMKPMLLTLISVTALALLILLGLWSGMKSADGGYLAYDAAVSKVAGMIGDGDFFKAEEALNAVEKTYAVADATRLRRAQVALGKKAFSDAEGILSQVSNKQSREYYTILGKLYQEQKKYVQAQGVYVAAARDWPLWTQVQRAAGAQAVCNKNYTVGEYYLLRASEQEPSDPVSLYFIGVIRFEQGDFNEAEAYFTEAMDLGLDKEFSGYVAWYRQEMKGGGL
jgi:tetratricopeptide (TPR) repeat protein